jgi:hypothetical protein
MKKFFRIVWAVFGIAMILRFSHWPGTALLLIVSVFLLFVFAIVFAFKNTREKLPEKIFHFTLFLWSAYLLWRIQFWDYSWYVLAIAVLVSITWIILTIVEVKQFRLQQGILSLYIVLNVSLVFVPAHPIFYLYNLNEIFYGKSRDENHYAWDRYSYFLYLDKQYEASLVANDNARVALEKVQSFMDKADYHEIDDLLEQARADIAMHREMIEKRALDKP